MAARPPDAPRHRGRAGARASAYAAASRTAAARSGPPLGDWRSVVLNRHLVDWAALEARTPTAGLTSVIVPTYDDGELTTACVESLLRGPTATSRSSSGTTAPSPEVAAALDRLAGGPGAGRTTPGEPRLRARQQPRPRARAPATSSCSSTTTPRSPPGWLAPAARGPGRRRRARRAAAAALPDRRRSSPPGSPSRPAAGCRTRSSRASRPRTRTASRGCGSTRSPGAALALRYADAVALRGFDPVFTNGMEDVDLCHRLAQRRGRATSGSSTAAPVVHHESRTPGPLRQAPRQPRRLPRPLAAGRRAARRRRALGHPRAARGRPRHRPGPARRAAAAADPAAGAGPRGPAPGHARRRGCAGRSRTPPPPDPGGERWGDTHFAASLAAALRDHGQEVVVDRRPEWDRRHRPPRRRRARAARPGPPRPEPRAGLAALGDLAPRRWSPPTRRAATTGCSPPAQPWAERRARDWALPHRAAAAGHRPASGSTPTPGVPGTGDPVLFVGNSRRQLRPVVRDALAAGLPLAVYGDLWSGLVPDEVVHGRSIPNDAARRGVPLRRRRPQRPPRRHARRRVRLQPALRRRRQRGPGDHRPDVDGRAGRAVRPGGPGLRDPDDLARLATLADPDAVFGDDATRRAAADRVRREHSFAARAARLVEVAHEARAARTSG